MNVIDSSGWLEFFGEEPGAAFFAAVIGDSSKLLVPSIVIFEVYKRTLQTAGEKKALEAAVVMGRGEAVDLDASLAFEAAHLSIEHRLAMADSIIYATARRHKATLWTQDADLKGLPGVKYREKKPR